MILMRIFQERETGFYVDVGAHHPKRLSNSYYFYQKGWSGINIDAMPGSMKLFRKMRPRDINVEAAIAKSPQELTFYLFNSPALNTFDKALAYSRNGVNGVRIIGEREIVTQTLRAVLSKHMPVGKSIQFMSVDVEGLDMEVLESNDWQQFRPEYVLVECWGLRLRNTLESPVVRYLDSVGYELFAKSYSTAVFKERSL